MHRRSKIKYNAVLLLIVLFAGKLDAQQLFDTKNKELHQSLNQLYHFNFTSSDSIILSLKKDSKNDVELFLLHTNYYWWKIISGEDTEENRKNYLITVNAAQSIADTFKTTHNDQKLYEIISVNAYKSRIEGLNKNYIKAFGHINNCLRQIEQSFGREKQFEYFNLTSGLYNYYVATANKNFPVLIPYLALFPKGNASKGIQQLETAANSSDQALSTEALYFLMKLYMDDQNYRKALEYSSRLIRLYPENLLYLYYDFKLLLLSDNKKEALNRLASMNLQSKINRSLSANQRKHFLVLAQKDLEEYHRQKN